MEIKENFQALLLNEMMEINGGGWKEIGKETVKGATVGAVVGSRAAGGPGALAGAVLGGLTGALAESAGDAYEGAKKVITNLF